MKRLALGLGLVVLAAVTAACSGAAAAPATGGPAASPQAGDGTTIVAKDLAFATTAVSVKADEPTTIVLDNQDNVPHNIAIKDASGATVFKGDIVSGSKVANAVPGLAKGQYTFWCEIHPNMTGTISAG
ncbi:MAG TPA: cupredoxin domain-containing protein [Candidatus Limnocylindrales bacterium]|jgi:plastocyanin|nr:cupredoxin domain-containing protein [Candidatus Limnocylindrales bacterium]